MLPEQKGLTSSEAENRLKKYGPNALPEKPPPSAFSILLAQFKSPLVYVLLVAGLVTLLLGDFSDAAIIGLAIMLNTVLGFIQENKADRALTALEKLIHPTTKVVRDGQIKQIEIEKIVPGDIVILEQGAKIPADGELLKANRFFTLEAILTGESLPVEKKQKDQVYMGTTVSAGRGLLKVSKTGGQTEIGKIALGVQAVEEDTPLRRQLAAFSRQLVVVVLFLIIFVFVVGLLLGRDLIEIFKTSVALAVSSIPEGLLVALTVILAIGMQKILRRKGLVRNLVSAETLGGVTVICTDKTGTLTQGQMKVSEYFGDREGLAIQAILANDFDDPITIAAFNWAKAENKNHQAILDHHQSLDSIPFSSDNRFFASLNKWKGDKMIFVNGAPEYIFSWSKKNKVQWQEIQREIAKLTKKGRRVVGFARKTVSASKSKITNQDIQEGLEWVGLLAFADTIREGVRQALNKALAAGVGTIVITGDYSETAKHVMLECGLKVNNDEIMLGDELQKISDVELSSKLKGNHPIRLFARTTPAQKLKIVEALKKNGEVVAMMGDGANDALALKKADIGIVVAEASDVAKETADLVLLDSSFATIIAAIEEGRGIFDNIRKIILYLMSDAFEEIIAVMATIVLRLPLPVTAGQILWINLISDGFPNLALTVDPQVGDIMARKPRPPKEPLVANWMKYLIIIVSLVGGLAAFAVFLIVYYQSGGNESLARSTAFATLGINSLIYVFSVRTLTSPFWIENPFSNKWLDASVFLGFILQISPFLFESTRQFLRLERLTLFDWSLVFLAAIMMFLVIELAKAIFRFDTLHHKT